MPCPELSAFSSHTSFHQDSTLAQTKTQRLIYNILPFPGSRQSAWPRLAAGRSFHSPWGAHRNAKGSLQCYHSSCQRQAQRPGASSVWKHSRCNEGSLQAECQRPWESQRLPGQTPICWETEASPLEAQWSGCQCPQNRGLPGSQNRISVNNSRELRKTL